MLTILPPNSRHTEFEQLLKLCASQDHYASEIGSPHELSTDLKQVLMLRPNSILGSTQNHLFTMLLDAGCHCISLSSTQSAPRETTRINNLQLKRTPYPHHDPYHKLNLHIGGHHFKGTLFLPTQSSLSIRLDNSQPFSLQPLLFLPHPQLPLISQIRSGQQKMTFLHCGDAFTNDNIFKADNIAFWSFLLQILINAPPLSHHRRTQKKADSFLHPYPPKDQLRAMRAPIPIRYDRRYLLGESQLSPPTESKAIALGVIPHRQCMTQKKQCGFCVYNDETYQVEQVEASIAAVCTELRIRKQRSPQLLQSPVHSIYFGGGTANISPFEHWSQLLKEMGTLKTTAQTEITLEGVPLYFAQRSKMLDIMQNAFPEAKHRIHIGVQTFQPQMLKLMGRSKLNAQLLEAVKAAQSRQISVSLDLLCNLPRQSKVDIIDDIKRAVDLGVEHISLYPLRCFPELDTPWAKDPRILKSLPDNTQAFENLQTAWASFAQHGFQATSVVDFQKQGSGEASRFRYAEALRFPERVDWLGLGPGGVSLLTDPPFRSGYTFLNPTSTQSYIHSVQRAQSSRVEKAIWTHFFQHAPEDLELYWLSRQILSGRISTERFLELFEAPLQARFDWACSTLEREGLLAPSKAGYLLTARGMFHASTIIDIFAERRRQELTLS